MKDIDTLIEENRTNHYKLLTIVGNNQSKQDEIIDYLENNDWDVYDVEEEAIKIAEDIPNEKINIRIATKIKEWVKSLGNRLVFINSNILYSKEMDRIGPFDAFKYLMRGDKEGILFLDAKLSGNVAIYSKPGRLDYNERDLSEVKFTEIDEVDIPEE